MEHFDPQSVLDKLREIEQQARLVLDEMIAVPSIHRVRLLHIVTLAQSLQTLVDGVRAAIAHGESLSQAIAHVGVAEKPHWLLWDSSHAHNVDRVYQELEWE